MQNEHDMAFLFSELQRLFEEGATHTGNKLFTTELAADAVYYLRLLAYEFRANFPDVDPPSIFGDRNGFISHPVLATREQFEELFAFFDSELAPGV